MDEQVSLLEAARAIRPFLPELLTSDDAADDLDRELADLLERSSQGEEVEDLVAALLQQDEAAHNWAASFLESGLPPGLAAVDSERGGFAGLPGVGEPARADRFVCPQGDFVWFRRAVGQLAPNCPTHGPLVAAARDT